MSINTDIFVSVVIPVMNEEGNLPALSSEVIKNLQEYKDYEIIFIDDGSMDGTLALLKELNRANDKIKYLSFSRNFGHQSALRAGLDYSQGDCVISMDGDMQHPPELIPEMIAQWNNGDVDIVYTIRKDDLKLGFFKRISSRVFYKFLNYFSDISIEPGSADFRLLDKSVVNVLRTPHENPLFFRGIISWIGFKKTAIEYMPNQRNWGTSKYSVRKMFAFALNGILSFSIKPLLVSIYFGIFISFLAICYGIYAIFIKLFTTKSVSGWASMTAVVSFIGGIQLIVLGIIGIYLGRLFMDVKNRPPYIIKEKSHA
jgi:dolichol-phosphate mannosyltransferase